VLVVAPDTARAAETGGFDKTSSAPASLVVAQSMTIRPMVVALAVLGAACSSNTAQPVASGGSPGAGGVTSTGGATARGGQSGTGGTSGAGGTPSQGGTMGSGGATGPGTGGAPITGGSGGSGSGGLVTGGQPGGGGGGLGGALSAVGGTTRAGTGGSGGSGGATITGSGGDTVPGSGGAPSAGAGGTTGIGAGGTTGKGAGGTADAGTGGATGAGGAAADGGAVQSAGCGKTRTLQNGTINLTYGGAARKYILRVPDGYDNTSAYRLVLAYAWSGASASQVVSANYFRFATFDSKSTIFAAPEASDGAGTWSNADVAFTDAILAQLEGDLCIDETRVFATGFSFGGGMAMALACTRADVFRAVAFFSGADLTNSCPTNLTKPIAYFATQASEDANGMSRTNPMTGEMKQSQFAAVNGCTADANSTNFPAAGQPHVCTIYKGCSAGHPTEYCIFNGAHGWEPVDPGQTTSWAPPEAWKFITQF
jgi:poly(3-hydroxybutyrate) depolymerase